MTESETAAESKVESRAPEVKGEHAAETKKLTNKELKELKKKEKAAKRSAKKQENGVTVEEQQKLAQAKREKKRQQREHQQQQQRERELKNEAKQQKKRHIKKSTLFGHLETTEERRGTILALMSAITASQVSRITAAGLMVPTITSGSMVAKTPASSAGSSSDEVTSTAELAKSLATMNLESEEFSVVPGMSSIIPRATEQLFSPPQAVTSFKELLINKSLVHPAITLLTFQLANYKIVGSIPRCIAMLEAFQQVVKDYQTPHGTTLSRNLTSYLSHQIDILKKARPLSVTMGNAIRWLKQEISVIDPSTPDKEAKRILCEKIAQFAREKIELADQLIIDAGSQHVENGSTIVTYGSSKVVTDLLIYNAVELKKDFEVIVVDSRPLFEGRKMADRLRSRGVNVVYALITSLDSIFNMDVDYVFLGAHSILSNGFLYSRVGTAMLAMCAKRRNIPVLVCCESLKFSQRVQLDSVTLNELADPNDLVTIRPDNSSVDHSHDDLLSQFIKEREEQKKNSSQENKPNGKSSSPITVPPADDSKRNILDGWQNIHSLNIVNILYDLTPPEYIKKIITEFGSLPPSSVPVILREYKSLA
ncbi:ZYBA0S04-10330g1_1 [Zygosaccharomyces bailii CLIB 213]|uniref:Translation initiation factor eIF2B subunit delta n=1 Tax=Zygosaccharomyces bailii (strain CLIB 213 / ATCC 58445 / CBS 680 / BCRC 21525 / NBRC 1098 / NCYC 1416 / NRRL Y-2227) TaxID=1333698 RepID=A0A8J2X8Q2_ZYGB2|nr:ZYBA0S04-10330g1_1 [Zygosaccharomyces bailii CLIB 213]